MKSFKHVFIVFFVVMSMMVFTRNDVLAATATVDTSEVHQTIEGFGVSLAWWYQSLYSHSQKGEIYNYLFKELGLDIFRLRNIYGKEDYAFSMFGEIVDSFYSLSENEPKVMISSWSPPSDLKSNGNIVGGTLDQISEEYVYGDFARYWFDALDAFADVGIEPEYISIQNEPDWGRYHETCKFDPTENDTIAGYDRALDSVYIKLQELVTPPKILAPEVLGIGYNRFQSYTNQINHPEYVYGYAYHLYHGGDTANPDAFNGNLSTIAGGYSDKPIFQTECDLASGWLKEVWMMHNCLVYGNVSGFFHWTIVSTNAGSRAFVILDGSTYTLNHAYWAFRQYSKAIHYGWKRVGADIDEDSLRISAYISPDKYDLSVVVINISHNNDSLDLNVPNFNISGANILRTSATEKCDLVDYYNGSKLNLPARSITTISTLEINDVSGIEEEDYDSPNRADISLAQNYPNPFSAATSIEYSIREEGFVRLAIYDVSGREVRTLVARIMPAGKHTVSVELNGLSSGIYFYRLEAGGKNIQKKMISIR